jgi:WD40 repeat protein
MRPSLRGTDEKLRWGYESHPFDPGGGRLASGSTNKTLRLYDIALREKTEEEGHSFDVRAVAWSPDGALIATGSMDADFEFGEVFLWDASSGALVNELAEAHTGWVNALAFSPDGSMLASGSDDGTVIAWDVASGEKLHVLAGPGDSVRSVAWSGDGTMLAAGDSAGGVFVWDAASGSELYRMEDHTDMVYDIAFSTDGAHLYTASRDGVLAVRDPASGSQTNAIEGFTRSFYDITGKDNGAFIASSEGVVVEWDPAAIEIINVIGPFEESGGLLSTGAVQAVNYSPNGTTLAIGDPQGRIVLWDTASNTEIKTIGSRDAGHLNYVSGLDWSPDGTQIVTSSADTTVIFWDVEGGEPLQHYQPSDANTMNNVVFSADASTAIAVNQDGSIHAVDAATGDITYFWNPDRGINYDVALRPDGSTTIAVAHSNGDVTLWDFTTGEEVLTMEEALWHASAVAFSPDGSLIAAGDTDGNVAQWDAATGGLLQHYEGAHAGFISAVAFSPNGAVFVTLSSDGTILQWSAGP